MPAGERRRGGARSLPCQTRRDRQRLVPAAQDIARRDISRDAWPRQCSPATERIREGLAHAELESARLGTMWVDADAIRRQVRQQRQWIELVIEIRHDRRPP